MKFDYFDLLSGQPIEVAGVGHLRSPFLWEICPTKGVGYDIYNLYLNFLSWDKEQLLQYDKLMGLRGVERLEKADKLNCFDIATLIESTREFCRGVLSFFMSDNLEWMAGERKFVAYTPDDDGQHITGEINRDNFDAVRRYMLQLNFIALDQEEDPVTHTSEHAKELWEKAQRFLREQTKAKESVDRPEYHIGNIISKLCAVHPSYNFLNIFQLTVFQLYDAFFQVGYLRSSDLNEQIFSNHGGKNFKFEDWLKPILRHV